MSLYYENSSDFIDPLRSRGSSEAPRAHCEHQCTQGVSVTVADITMVLPVPDTVLSTVNLHDSSTTALNFQMKLKHKDVKFLKVEPVFSCR